ncbi:MAG: DegV family EDD domain-containing protein [Lachnospiraceae bacterium]|nr:DegV family EDD domain-containing protein [Lachnospiraceae bacterium]
MRKFFERKSETEKYVYQSAVKVDFWFFVGITIYEIFHMVYTFVFADAYGELVIFSRLAYGISGLSTALFSVACFYAMQNIDRRYKILKIANELNTFFILGLAVVVTILDSIRSGVMDTTLIIVMSFIMPLLLYMPVSAYLTMFLLANGSVLYYYITLAMVDSVKYGAVKYYAIYIFISVIIIIIIMYVKYSTYDRILESNRQKDEIEKLNAAQNRFFSSMSHEIRTPINTIIGLNEMILREDVSDEVAEDAANIQSASKMLLHLINDILDMSKFASGSMKLNPVEYHPGDMLSDIVGMLWLRAKDKGLEFHVSVAPDIPDILYGDEVRIKQILINIINNAIKYTAEGSVTLSIQCGERNGNNLNIIYSVTDTGMGIKKEDIPYLFTAFKRVDETENRHIEGTGLGLSIVKQFADLMGGKVTVNSIYTQGSTFIVELPQKVVGHGFIGDLKIEERHSLNKRHEYKQKFEAPDARILVVDDNASNLLVVKKLLRDTKVQLDTAKSGAEALEKTLDTYYNVIFMDHLMPEMDGIECLKRIRTQTGGQSISSKVVALTANAGSDVQALYAREGFDGYLVKPVTGDALEKELYRLLPADLVIAMGDNVEIAEETVSWMQTHDNKKSVIITTDSVADLPEEIIEKYGIAVIPHVVCTKEGNFRDGIEIETRGLLAYMEDENHVAENGVPTVAEHEAFFAKQLSRANNIIHVSITSKAAGSAYPVASEAAGSFDNVFVVDSGHLSSGLGLMVIAACQMAEEGKSPMDIVEELDKVKDLVHTSFIVNNMDFLARTGQVNKKVADITKTLMFHPVITLKNGVMGLGRVYMGTTERGWVRYINDCLRNMKDADKDVLFITYVGLNKKDIEYIKEILEDRTEFKHIYFQQASPVIALNCGAGTFGLLYKDRPSSGRII